MTIAYFPFILACEFLIILGLSLALAAFNVYFRDVQFIWKVIVQIGFFATPIIYPITIFSENVRWLVMLNPMAQIITMMRDCILSPDGARKLESDLLDCILIAGALNRLYYLRPSGAQICRGDLGWQ